MDIQTEVTQRTTTLHSWVVTIGKSRVYPLKQQSHGINKFDSSAPVALLVYNA